jgi:hypothetical protein
VQKQLAVKMSLTHSRYYEAKYPEVDELVMVTVKQVCCTPLPRGDFFGSDWTDC